MSKTERYSATVFLGRGKFDTEYAPTQAEAVQKGLALLAKHSIPENAIIYAIAPNGTSTFRENVKRH